MDEGTDLHITRRHDALLASGVSDLPPFLTVSFQHYKPFSLMHGQFILAVSSEIVQGDCPSTIARRSVLFMLHMRLLFFLFLFVRLGRDLFRLFLGKVH